MNDLNGYAMQAESYRRLLEREGEGYSENTRKEIEDNIRVFDKLATFEKDDKYIAFDSGMFNDIFRAYVDILLKRHVEDEKLRDEINSAAYHILDSMTAKEAEDLYFGRNDWTDVSDKG